MADGFMLSDAEKARFCGWLEMQAKSNREMAGMLESQNHKAMAGRMKARAMAQEIVRQDILEAEPG